jgi:hypothetical protein
MVKPAVVQASGGVRAVKTEPSWKSHLSDAINAAKVQASVRKVPVGIALVWHAGRWATYSADAWDQPEGRGFLPWHPPPGRPVVVVQADGTWREL